MKKLCNYKDFFGEARTGVHSYRFMDIALFDLILTLIVAYILSQVTQSSFWKLTLSLFLLGIFLHWVFCVPTTINQLLGQLF